MTIENRPSAPPSLHRPFPLTTPPRSSLRYGILLDKKDTSLWLPCTIEMPTAPLSSTILHKLYASPFILHQAKLTHLQSSLDKAKAWVKELQRQANENIIIALAGNKSDLVAEHPDKRAITTLDAEAYAREAGLLFFETSAKTAENVRELFTAIARKLPLEQAGARNMRSSRRQDVDLRPEAPGTQGAGACNC